MVAGRLDMPRGIYLTGLPLLAPKIPESIGSERQLQVNICHDEILPACNLMTC